MTLRASSLPAGRGASGSTVIVSAMLNGVAVPLVLDADAVAAIAAVVAPRETTPVWLYGDRAAAAYLGWPLGRVQKLSAAGLLPCHRLGQRKAYRCDELDRLLADH